MIILISIVACAALNDIKYARIPNILIAIGLVSGLVYSVINGGVGAMAAAIVQSVLFLIISYPLYMIRAIGAGDIKLYMMAGCFLEKSQYIKCLVFALLISGVLATIKLIMYSDCRKRWCYLCGYLRKIIYTGAVDAYEITMKENPKEGIRLAVPLFLSIILSILPLAAERGF